MRAWFVALFAAAQFGVSLSAAAASAPPSARLPRATLLSVDAEAAAQLLDAQGRPHVVHARLHTRGGGVVHSWFDGMHWRHRSLSADAVDRAAPPLQAVGAVRIGSDMHAFVLSQASPLAARDLVHLRVDATGAVTRRVLEPGTSIISLHPMPDAAGALVLVVTRSMTGVPTSYGLVRTPLATPQESPLPLSGQLVSAATVPGDAIYLLSALQSPVTVLRVTQGATTEIVTEPFNGPESPTRMAVTAGVTGPEVLVQLRDGDSATLRHYVRSQSQGWNCTIPCETAASDWRGPLLFGIDAAAGARAALYRSISSPDLALRLSEGGAAPFGDEQLIRPAGDGPNIELPFGLNVRGTQAWVLTRGPGGLASISLQSNWQENAAPTAAAATVRSALSLAVAPHGEAVLLGDAGPAPASGLIATRFDPALQQYVAEPLVPGQRVAAAAHGFAPDGSLHAALHAVPGDDFVYLQRNPGAAATTLTLQSSGRTGHSPGIAIDDRGGIAVVWYDLDRDRVQAALRPPGAASFAIEDVSMARYRAPRVAVQAETGQVFVSMRHDSVPYLRVFRRGVDGRYELSMDSGSDDVDDDYAIAVDAYGQPAMLYVTVGINRRVVTYKHRPNGSLDTFASVALLPSWPAGATYSQLHLALAQGSSNHVHAAWLRDFEGETRLFQASYDTRGAATAQGFDVRDFGPLAASNAAAGIALAARPQALLAWTDAAGTRLARHSGDPSTTTPSRSDPITTATAAATTGEPEGKYVLYICFCTLFPGFCDPTHGKVADSGLAQQLRDRFETSTAGRHYLDLFGVHGAEIARITTANPRHHADRAQTYALFAPGLQGFVDGRGSDFRMDAEMLARARGVWQHWATAGSPALRATVEAELLRTDDLRRFEGMTFEEWFAALPQPAEVPLFRDGFED